MFADFRFPLSNLDLPATERAIAEAVGRSATIRLSVRTWVRSPYAGKHKRGVVYVPKKLSDKFIASVGDTEAAHALVGSYGGELLELSGCSGALRRLQIHCIRKLIAHGATRRDLQRATGFSDRQLRRIRASEDAAEPWPDAKIARHLAELSALTLQIRHDPLAR